MAEHPSVGATAAEPRKSRVVRRSIHISVLVILGFVFLGFWAMARLALCWGSQVGILASIFCNLHWVTVLALLAVGIILIYLIKELSDTEAVESMGLDIGVKMQLRQRPAAAYRAYRKLSRAEFTHVTIALIAASALVIFLLWLFLLSPVVF